MHRSGAADFFSVRLDSSAPSHVEDVLAHIERKFHKEDEFKIKSRVIILLTDGEQNAGKYTPEKAAEAAAALGIKVYAIGAITGFLSASICRKRCAYRISMSARCPRISRMHHLSGDGL